MNDQFPPRPPANRDGRHRTRPPRRLAPHSRHRRHRHPHLRGQNTPPVPQPTRI